MSRAASITGTITLEDGSTSEFTIGGEGWQQYAADQPRLGRSVDIVETMTAALIDEYLLTDPYSDPDPEED